MVLFFSLSLVLCAPDRLYGTLIGIDIGFLNLNIQSANSTAARGTELEVSESSE
jgi:hypothetical protein